MLALLLKRTTRPNLRTGQSLEPAMMKLTMIRIAMPTEKIKAPTAPELLGPQGALPEQQDCEQADQHKPGSMALLV